MYAKFGCTPSKSVERVRWQTDDKTEIREADKLTEAVHYMGRQPHGTDATLHLYGWFTWNIMLSLDYLDRKYIPSTINKIGEYKYCRRKEINFFIFFFLKLKNI